MKKVLQYLELPLINVVLTPIIIGLIFSLNIYIGVSVLYFVALIMYIFPAGILFSKIKDNKIRIISAIATVVLYFIVGIIMAIWSNNSDTGDWASMITLPISSFLCNRLFQLGTVSSVFLILFAPLPVLISVGSAKVFATDKKWVKIVGAVCIIALVCGSAVSSGLGLNEMFNGDYSYVGDDGQVYNAYYDMNGVKYEDNRDVPYYDREGNVYYWTYDESVDTQEHFWYCGEMTDAQGNTYDIECTYVDTEGYVVIDTDNSIEFRENLNFDVETDWCYIDKNGNIYASILGISYLSDGTPFTAVGDEYRDK